MDMIGENVLVYQQFSDFGSLKPPFVVKIEGETPLMWKIMFKDRNSETIRRLVNKGCCSTKPVYTDTATTKKTKRIRLKLKKSYSEA